MKQWPKETIIRKISDFKVKSQDEKIFEIIKYVRYPSIKIEGEAEIIFITSHRDPVRFSSDGTYEILTESGLVKAIQI